MRGGPRSRSEYGAYPPKIMGRHLRHFEHLAYAQLHTSGPKCRGTADWLAGRRAVIAAQTTVTLHEVAYVAIARAPRCQARTARNRVVHTGVIQVIEQIECLDHQLQRTSFAYREPARQPRIEGPEAGPNPDIAAGEVR